MNTLLALPIVVPLSAAVLTLLVWQWPRLQRAISIAAAAALLAAGLRLVALTRADGVLAIQIGGWAPPFGITLVADLFSALMVSVAGLVGLAVAVYSTVTVGRDRELFGYHALLLTLLAGAAGAFMSGDLFNLFVWFEVTLIASFVLMSLGGTRPQIEGAVKYVTLNLIASSMFLAAVGVLYGIAGTLNLADLARTLDQRGASGVVTAVSMLLFVAFGIKAALFPFFFWLPASYHTPPAAISALFAGLLTKVGLYALIRVFTLLFVHDADATHTLILAIAGATMAVGVLGALAQHDFRRVLSFHVVSQVGFMAIGLGLFTRLALAGSVFYIVEHIIVNTNLFLISGSVGRLRGSFGLDAPGGLYARRPLLALLFLVPALSLAGVPPLSGFFGKLALLQASAEAGAYAIAAAALVVSFLTLLSMARLWNDAFWKEAGDGGRAPEEPGRAPLVTFATVLPVAGLAAITVIIGFGAEALFDLAGRAADQLLDRQAYIAAVMGGGGGGSQ